MSINNNLRTFILHTINNSPTSNKSLLTEWIITFKPEFIFLSETHCSSASGESFVRSHPLLSSIYDSYWSAPHPSTRGFAGVGIIFNRKAFTPDKETHPLHLVHGHALGIHGTLHPPSPFPSIQVLLIAVYLPFDKASRNRVWAILTSRIKDLSSSPIIIGGDFNQPPNQTAKILRDSAIQHHLLLDWPKVGRPVIDYFAFITEHVNPPPLLREHQWHSANVAPPFKVTNHANLASLSLITSYAPMFHPLSKSRPLHLRFRQWYYDHGDIERQDLAKLLEPLVAPIPPDAHSIQHWSMTKLRIQAAIASFMDQQDEGKKLRLKILSKMKTALIQYSLPGTSRSRKKNLMRRLRKLRKYKVHLQLKSPSPPLQSNVSSTQRKHVPLTEIMNSIPKTNNSKPWYELIDPSLMHEQWIQHFQNPYADAQLEMSEDRYEDIPNCTPSLKYITNFIRNPPLGKAPGPDQICGEIIKLLPVHPTALILQQVYEDLATQAPPPEFLGATIWFIYKGKGDEKDPHAYRPISLLNLDLTLLSKWILLQIDKHLPTWIPDTQQGFMANRWTINNIRYAQDLRASLMSPPVRRALQIHQHGALIGFLDFKKAFDTCRWSHIQAAIKMLNPHSPLLQFWIPRLYRHHHSSLLGSDLQFEISQGVRQGDPMSPIIFNLFLQFLHIYILNLNIPLEIIPQHPGLQTTFLTAFPSMVKYADDILLFAHLGTGLAILRAIEAWSETSGMHLQPKKCTLLYLDTSGDQVKTIAQLRDLHYDLLPLFTIKADLCDKYLGIFLHPCPSVQLSLWRQDLNKKVKHATKVVNGISARRIIPLAHKAQLLNIYVGSQLLYSFFSLYPPPDLIRSLNMIYTDYLFPNKAPHPPLGKLSEGTDKGGLCLHTPDLLAQLAVSVAATKILSPDTPSWVTAPARLHAQLSARKKYPLHPFWQNLPNRLSSYDTRYQLLPEVILLKSPLCDPPLPILHPIDFRQPSGLVIPFNVESLWDLPLPVRMVNFFFLALWSMERAFGSFSSEAEASRKCRICMQPAAPVFKHWLSCGTLTTAFDIEKFLRKKESDSMDPMLASLDWPTLLSWIAKPTPDLQPLSARLSTVVALVYVRWILYTRITLHVDVQRSVYQYAKYIPYVQYIKRYHFKHPRHVDKLLCLAELLDDELEWDVHVKLHS